MRISRVLIAASFAAALSCASAHAGSSTINTGQPLTSADLDSLVVRQLALAAASDINNLIGMNANSSCPASPVVGQDCLLISTNPYTWQKWTGSTGGWATIGTINPSTGVFTPQLGSTSIIATPPISVGFSAGVATFGLNIDSNFAVTGGNLALTPIASGDLIANCSGSLAEPTLSTFTSCLDRNIGSTNGMFPSRIGGAWTSATFGTGLAFSGSALNLQPASVGAIGGVNSIAAVSHQWVNSISTAGLPALSQPAIADISGWGTNVATAVGTALNASGGLASSASPTFSGTFAGSYTLGGTPTIPGAALSGTFSGTPTFSGAAFITFANLANVNASSLLGDPTGSGAAASNITLGSTLNFSGSTLNCTAMSATQVGCGEPDNTTIQIVAGKMTAIGSAATSIDAGGATTSITNGTTNYLLADIGGFVSKVSIAGVTTQNILCNPEVGFDTFAEGGAYASISGQEHYGPDCFRFQGTFGAGGNGAIQIQRVTTAPAGFNNSLAVTVTTKDTAPQALDNFHVEIPIEGINARLLQFGTATAQAFTLQWQQACTSNGNYAVTVINGNDTRYFVQAPAYSGSGAFQPMSITVPGDTSGTWSTAVNAFGPKIIFNYGSGSTYSQASASVAWASGAIWNITGSYQLAQQTAGTVCFLTAFQIDLGNQPLPYRNVPLSQQQLFVMRYQRKNIPTGTAAAQNAGSAAAITYISQIAGTATGGGANTPFPVEMAGTPTITTLNWGAANNKWRTGGGVDSGTPSVFFLGSTGFFLDNPQVSGDVAGSVMGINYFACAALGGC